MNNIILDLKESSNNNINFEKINNDNLINFINNNFTYFNIYEINCISNKYGIINYDCILYIKTGCMEITIIDKYHNKIKKTINNNMYIIINKMNWIEYNISGELLDVLLIINKNISDLIICNKFNDFINYDLYCIY